MEEITDIKGAPLKVGDDIAFTDYNDHVIRIGKLVRLSNTNVYCEVPYTRPDGIYEPRPTRMQINYSKVRILKLN